MCFVRLSSIVPNRRENKIELNEGPENGHYKNLQSSYNVTSARIIHIRAMSSSCICTLLAKLKRELAASYMIGRTFLFPFLFRFLLFLSFLFPFFFPFHLSD